MADTVSLDDLLSEVEPASDARRLVVHALRAVSLVGSKTGLPITLQRV